MVPHFTVEDQIFFHNSLDNLRNNFHGLIFDTLERAKFLSVEEERIVFNWSWWDRINVLLDYVWDFLNEWFWSLLHDTEWNEATGEVVNKVLNLNMISMLLKFFNRIMKMVFKSCTPKLWRNKSACTWWAHKVCYLGQLVKVIVLSLSHELQKYRVVKIRRSNPLRQFSVPFT